MRPMQAMICYHVLYRANPRLVLGNVTVAFQLSGLSSWEHSAVRIPDSAFPARPPYFHPLIQTYMLRNRLDPILTRSALALRGIFGPMKSSIATMPTGMISTASGRFVRRVAPKMTTATRISAGNP